MDTHKENERCLFLYKFYGKEGMGKGKWSGVRPFWLLWMCFFSIQDEDNTCEMDEDIKIIATSDSLKQESLISEAEVDPMDAEQTWPSEEEIKEADGMLDIFFMLTLVHLCLILLIRVADVEEHWEHWELPLTWHQRGWKV